jgi:hypothetical protein
MLGACHGFFSFLGMGLNIDFEYRRIVATPLRIKAENWGHGFGKSRMGVLLTLAT